MSMNRVALMGRLAHDPELRRTQNGDAVTSFSIACDRDFKGKDGQRAVDWIDIVAWRQTAEFAAKYLAKGRMVIVDGRLQTRKWTDRYGGTRVATEVIAEHLYFGDSRQEGAQSAAPKAQTFEEIMEEDGDLPF